MQYTNEQLAMMAKAGEPDATAMLWEQVNRLIYKLMSRYYPLCKRNNIEVEDLEQSAYFVLVRAIGNYNPEKGLLFTSYLSHHVSNVAREALGLRGTKKRPGWVASLDEPAPGVDDDSLRLMDVIPDPDAALPFEQIQEDWQRSQLRTVLEDCLDTIPQERAMVLRRRYYERKTLQAVGDELGVTREQARQLEAKAMRDMRKPRNSRQLRPFLDEVIQSQAYKGTGLQSFRDKQSSSVERIYEQMEERMEARRRHLQEQLEQAGNI